MATGREFQIVGAATAKLREPKHVRTRGTKESDERKVYEMECNVSGIQCDPVICVSGLRSITHYLQPFRRYRRFCTPRAIFPYPTPIPAELGCSL